MTPTTTATERARQRARERIGRRSVFDAQRNTHKAREDEVLLERIRNGLCPEPSRITNALDAGDHYGPEVDVACGVTEPTVDEWERGNITPTLAQIKLLGALTGYGWQWFYREPLSTPDGGFICGPRGCKPLGGDRYEEGRRDGLRDAAQPPLEFT